MLQIGIIGTGWFSRVHADLLAQAADVRLSAVCGTSKEKADRLASAYRDAKGYGSLTEMLESERLDAVYVCVPPMAHGDLERELIARRIPFLVEKPIALDMQLPIELEKAIREQALITSVGYHFRYLPSVQRLKAELEGRTLAMASGEWSGSMPQVSWWRRQDGSGGQFIEQTTHVVDLLRYAAGEVEEVYAAYAGRVVHKQYEGVSVPDVGSVTLKLASGAVAGIINTCALPSGVGRSGLTLYTDQGMLAWTPKNLEIVTSEGREQAADEEANPYAAESEAFLHAVRTGDSSRIRSDYADALRTQQVTCAALESAASGLPVKLERL
ncbi:Predicted dehydrogenase [Paenibacillus sp. UNCCL117]|uniref:Gfo/Idh/MocA family protein n=1 Tax=unclassified Paenibacillus TaxID=185978 RepID=UPI000887CCBA|nr:Predicted dehydrogenase [Paenibacillus sp. cl123]SFW34127.1 Predicted dehydrogenase [Paenibacillus sp. UNCCL117]